VQESHPASTDEIELKAVVPDLAATRARVEAAGAALVFEGRLEDRRWDDAARSLGARDEVLRTRVALPRTVGTAHASLDWKGPTRRVNGYKVREERSTSVGDVEVVTLALRRSGLVIVREVDRDVVQYELHGAMLRFERYPRMDDLLEVEGTPAAIERAIGTTGLPRAAFGTERLTDHIARFEARTGQRAATCARELGGAFPFARDDG
jgi:adenylate cyclase class IV